MKKILNEPADVIHDYIDGLVSAIPSIARVDGWPVVVRAAAARKAAGRVMLISGGGSGHEPAHAGYVGHGMLDAAVLGPVFTSPSTDSIDAAIRSTAGDAGVVLIVKNYTGDRLNFGLAAEMARRAGIRVETIVVADDAALGESSRAGRRGLASTVLAHKVAGAGAERGWPIERVVDTTRRLLARAATMGVALGPCTVPGAVAPNFELGPDEIEWGLGIHGEPGRERGATAQSSVLAQRLVDVVCTDLRLSSGDDVVVMVNSLGGTPDLELRILQRDVLTQVRRHGLRVRMTWAGPFLTSLEMPGASVTVAAVDDELLGLLGDEAQVTAFPRATPLLECRGETVAAPQRFGPALSATGPRPDAVVAVNRLVGEVVDAVERAEPNLSDLDRRVGDGDLGLNLARGARAIRGAAESLDAQPDVAAYFTAVAELVRREVGGTSGPLYSLFLLAVAERLTGTTCPAPVEWAEAAAAGAQRVREVGGARPGDRTLVDALQPAVDALVAGSGTTVAHVAAAARAARAGVFATAQMKPALGRSSYLGDRAIGVPDPGAEAVAVAFEALAGALGAGPDPGAAP